MNKFVATENKNLEKMRKFFKAFFSGSRSGEETLSTGPIEEWRKEQFVLWLKEKEFDQSIVDGRLNILKELII